MPAPEVINKFRKSPTSFIATMWGLAPQPLKPEYVEKAKTVGLKEFRADWFLPFEKGKHITWQQWIILLAVEKSLKFAAPKRISVRSGHGIGKDAILSMLILWYLFCFKDAQIPCTAPTSEQIHDILWKEIAIWLSRMPEDVKGYYEWTTGYVRIKSRAETWFARARTARKENPEALAGIHGDFVFMVGDEASGIADEIFRPAEGALTNENVLMILISNPTRLLGYFYETHHSDRMNWQTLSFSSEDSPIVEQGYCDRIITKYGQDSNEYRFMVKGEFPAEDTIDDKGFVPLFESTDLKSSQNDKFAGNLRLGIDPAGMGKNETVWVLRDNFKAKRIAKESTSTGKSIAEKTITLCDFFGIIKAKQNKNITIDAFGIGVDAVKELALLGWNINTVNVGEKPSTNTPEEEEEAKLYLNKRALAYDRIKRWLRSGGELVNKDDFKELLGIKYKKTLQGKMQIMSKEEMRKLGIESPDTGDALSLTFIEKPTQEVEASFKKYKQKDYESPWDFQG